MSLMELPSTSLPTTLWHAIISNSNISSNLFFIFKAKLILIDRGHDNRELKYEAIAYDIILLGGGTEEGEAAPMEIDENEEGRSGGGSCGSEEVEPEVAGGINSDVRGRNVGRIRARIGRYLEVEEIGFSALDSCLVFGKIISTKEALIEEG